MKTFKISCRKVKISISPWGGNFQPEVKGMYISKISHPGVNFTLPTCNMPLIAYAKVLGNTCDGARF